MRVAQRSMASLYDKEQHTEPRADLSHNVSDISVKSIGGAPWRQGARN
jgi:hypothetical protein